jgi:hypothetical protein
VFNNDCGIQIAADEIRHDVVVPFPMHARHEGGVGGRQAELLQIRTPGFGVKWHGVDNYAVEVEEKREIVHVPRVADQLSFLVLAYAMLCGAANAGRSRFSAGSSAL